MRSGLFTFLRTTTFKLALLYTVLFAVFSATLLAYLYYSTVGSIRRETAARLDTEIGALHEAYRAGGLERLNQSLVERASDPRRPFIYQLETTNGTKINGDLSRMPDGVLEPGVTSVFFTLEARAPDASVIEVQLEGRVIRFGPDLVLLVGYNRDEGSKIVRRITMAVYTAAPIGLVLSLIGGIVISGYAARRADSLTRTAEAVMSGDLSRRAPVLGSGDEFDRLGERMNAMLERIETLMLSARHTGDAIAHDLRSPLTRLRNRLVTALAEPLSAETAEETLGETLEELDHVLKTFNAILRLSRLEAGERGKMVRLDISSIARELADLYEPACEAAGLEFTCRISNNLHVLGDREMLAQATSNLLDNAVKYTPSGGAISFEVRRGRDGNVTLSVIDSGPGIPEELRGKAIKRFVRLDASRSAPGSGLGLSLVEAVADVHGGELDLLDAKGPPERPGLKAVLRLPRAK